MFLKLIFLVIGSFKVFFCNEVLSSYMEASNTFTLTPLIWDSLYKESKVPEIYESVREKLIAFKDKNWKIFYGGPVIRPNSTIWVMPIVEEDNNFRPKRVYEVAFINCNPNNTLGAKVYYIEGRDIDLKFKNCLSDSYDTFSKLMSGSFQGEKSYVIVRRCDVAMIAYPDVYIDFTYESFSPKELDKLSCYLHNKHNTNNKIKILNLFKKFKYNILNENRGMRVYVPEFVNAKFNDKNYKFYVYKILLKRDKWKIYYLISKSKNLFKIKTDTKLRIDSGCTGGQIYGDDSCDCADQFFKFFDEFGENGIVIHIPTHDGRGFGFAPKAETEIYKSYGNGFLHTTKPIDTVSAAKLLYQVRDNRYDIRDYKGIVKILKNLNCKFIYLFSDNVKKFNSLKSLGINIRRVPTNTNKSSCINHILAKKSDSSLYFK